MAASTHHHHVAQDGFGSLTRHSPVGENIQQPSKPFRRKDPVRCTVLQGWAAKQSPSGAKEGGEGGGGTKKSRCSAKDMKRSRDGRQSALHVDEVVVAAICGHGDRNNLKALLNRTACGSHEVTRANHAKSQVTSTPRRVGTT